MSQHGYCPDCDVRIPFRKKPTIGTQLDCPECGTSIEVIELNPIELTWAGEYELDSSDYADYDSGKHAYDFDEY